jgi:hypothetical protein
MKNIKIIFAIILVLTIVAGSLPSRAGDSQSAKAKPHPLNTCLFCGMQFGAMGEPYVFIYQGQEIKVCDKSEQADFDKDPQKYLKKLAAATAKLKQ